MAKDVYNLPQYRKDSMLRDYEEYMQSSSRASLTSITEEIAQLANVGDAKALEAMDALLKNINCRMFLSEITNFPSKSGSTLIFTAAWEGQRGLAEVLLKYEAKVNWQNIRGNTALHMAIEQNQLKMVELFLKYGATFSDGIAETIRSASKKPISKAIDDLLAHTAEKRKEFERDLREEEPHLLSTPLCISVKENDVGAVRKLTLVRDIKTIIDDRDYMGNTVLMIASIRGHLQCVKLLVNAGASVNLQNNEGRTALEWAIGMNHYSIAAYLVSECGAWTWSINLKYIRFWAPTAVSNRYQDLIEITSAKQQLQQENGQAQAFNMESKLGLTQAELVSYRKWFYYLSGGKPELSIKRFMKQMPHISKTFCMRMFDFANGFGSSQAPASADISQQKSKAMQSVSFQSFAKMQIARKREIQDGLAVKKDQMTKKALTAAASVELDIHELVMDDDVDTNILSSREELALYDDIEGWRRQVLAHPPRINSLETAIRQVGDPGRSLALRAREVELVDEAQHFLMNDPVFHRAIQLQKKGVIETSQISGLQYFAKDTENREVLVRSMETDARRQLGLNFSANDEQAEADRLQLGFSVENKQSKEKNGAVAQFNRDLPKFDEGLKNCVEFLQFYALGEQYDKQIRQLLEEEENSSESSSGSSSDSDSDSDETEGLGYVMDDDAVQEDADEENKKEEESSSDSEKEKEKEKEEKEGETEQTQFTMIRRRRPDLHSNPRSIWEHSWFAQRVHATMDFQPALSAYVPRKYNTEHIVQQKNKVELSDFTPFDPYDLTLNPAFTAHLPTYSSPVALRGGDNGTMEKESNRRFLAEQRLAAMKAQEQSSSLSVASQTLALENRRRPEQISPASPSSTPFKIHHPATAPYSSPSFFADRNRKLNLHTNEAAQAPSIVATNSFVPSRVGHNWMPSVYITDAPHGTTAVNQGQLKTSSSAHPSAAASSSAHPRLNAGRHLGQLNAQQASIYTVPNYAIRAPSPMSAQTPLQPIVKSKSRTFHNNNNNNDDGTDFSNNPNRGAHDFSRPNFLERNPSKFYLHSREGQGQGGPSSAAMRPMPAVFAHYHKQARLRTPADLDIYKRENW